MARRPDPCRCCPGRDGLVCQPLDQVKGRYNPRMNRSRRWRGGTKRIGAVVALLGSLSGTVLVLAISGTAGAVGSVATKAAGSPSSYSLAGVCPSTVVFQSDWDPAVGNDYDMYELA